jgi:hypothetical protein
VYGALRNCVTNVIARGRMIRVTMTRMDLKRLVAQFAYKIEPKPEGGFIARATDPSTPPLEAPTREELQRKIQKNILNFLSTEFPGLKLPEQGKNVKMAFHIEHTPGGGFSIHSADPNEPVIQTANHNELESHFLESFLSLAGKALAPELSKALAAQVGSANVKVVVNKRLGFRMNAGPSGISFGAPAKPALGPSTIQPSVDSTPITPEGENSWKLLAFLLAVVIVCGLIYFLGHR